jgi:hypothetical protein
MVQRPCTKPRIQLLRRERKKERSMSANDGPCAYFFFFFFFFLGFWSADGVCPTEADAPRGSRVLRSTIPQDLAVSTSHFVNSAVPALYLLYVLLIETEAMSLFQA